MNRARQLTAGIGKNVLQKGLKEHARLTDFYSLRKIHDLELECDLMLFEGKEEALGPRECPPKCVKIKPKGGWTHEKEI